MSIKYQDYQKQIAELQKKPEEARRGEVEKLTLEFWLF